MRQEGERKERKSRPYGRRKSLNQERQEREQKQSGKSPRYVPSEPIWGEMARELKIMEDAGISIYVDNIKKKPETAAYETMGEQNGHFTCKFDADEEGRPGLFFQRIQENKEEEDNKEG